MKTLQMLHVSGIAICMLAAQTLSAGEYNLTVDPVIIDTGNFTRVGVGYNGTSPGPVLRFKEGEDVIINITNNLSEMTSIHWHGLILPYQQDGVPGFSYNGIAPGETFTHRFPIVQSGTYWFHSHSPFQEPDGAYGAIIIEPKQREPFRYDREYVVQLTDAHPHGGKRIMRNLKLMPDYYNRQQRTIVDFFSDASEMGFQNALNDRLSWGEMRMMPNDIEDLQGFSPLMNGKSTDQNWTGLFKPGERIRLRFINSSAMTYFDIRIPGLKLTVVQADGNNVQPVNVDEFRIAVAETYDVIIRPEEDKAYAVFAESMGRTASVRGTLAPKPGMAAEVPALRKDPILTMADMGMSHDGMSMDHGAMGHSMPTTHVMPDGTTMQGDTHAGHKMPATMDHSQHTGMAMAASEAGDSFYAKGSGLMPSAANGGKFLSYNDLKAHKPLYEDREATREIELRLTGNMERYIWSINDIKFSDAEPIVLKYGERVRFKFVNETMMTHPMHLHGMWTIIDTGKGKWDPVKHVVSIAPGTTVYTETEVDAPGQWAFHCHLSYHADSGMFRRVIVEGGPEPKKSATLNTPQGG